MAQKLLINLKDLPFLIQKKLDSNYIDELISIFNKFDKSISRKYSSNRKFLSISINTKLDLPEEVIKIYKKTTHFKGLIRL